MKLCPYCGTEASGRKVSEDDFVDFCNECDVVIEGQTVDDSIVDSGVLK